MLRRILFAGLLAGIIGLTAVSGAGALAVPPAPTLERPIVDQTQTLSPTQIDDLSRQIAESRQKKSYQIGILIVPTMGNDEYLEGYAIKVAREWKIGDTSNNGVLILVAKNDKKMRIEVGKGLEGDLTDARSSQIVRNVMSPKFREGKFYEGLSGAINSIQLAVERQADPAATQKSSAKKSSFDLLHLLLFGIPVLMWIAAIMARSKSWWLGGVIGGVAGSVLALVFGWALWAIILGALLIPLGLLFDYIVSRNYSKHTQTDTLDTMPWWFGGFGGGSGGSGGGSFGGGDFGGGGASGDW